MKTSGTRPPVRRLCRSMMTTKTLNHHDGAVNARRATQETPALLHGCGRTSAVVTETRTEVQAKKVQTENQASGPHLCCRQVGCAGLTHITVTF
jgi:hypothetical protein